MSAPDLESLVPILITLAVLGGVFALASALIRYNRLQKEQASRRAERARELHWEYDDTRDGNIDFRIRGSCRGLRWELYYDSDRSSSDSSSNVVWRWRERPARRIELAIMGVLPDKIAFGSFGRGIITFVRRLGVKSRSHPDGDDFYQHALKIESDLTVFQQEWIVRARKPTLFRSVASHELAELLTKWPEHGYGRTFQPASVLSLLYDHEGLRLNCGYGVADMAILEHIVKIGCAVAVRIIALDPDSIA